MCNYKHINIEKQKLQHLILDRMRTNKIDEAFESCKKLAKLGFYEEATHEVIIMLFRELVGIRYLNEINKETVQKIIDWKKLLEENIKSETEEKTFYHFLELIKTLDNLPQNLRDNI